MMEGDVLKRTRLNLYLFNYCSAAHNQTSAIPNDKTGIGLVNGCFKRSIEIHLNKRATHQKGMHKVLKSLSTAKTNGR
ncbi:hypothetical protein J1N35_002279 [Gossypium stocksii]|uniref:Uncharacterized protein n=1 Tax=Gossypium stocksii TaxID=47602 RepID=A0A9D3WL02_9ROSI|nr:hypothetical protein J1N35_002279 [Gossypium stocksii]